MCSDHANVSANQRGGTLALRRKKNKGMSRPKPKMYVK